MLIGLAIVAGIVGWSGHVLALPVAFLFPALWAFSRSRLVAAGVAAGYFLAASRSLPQGVANFYASDLWPGLLLWIAASSSFVSVHAALWTNRPGRRRALRYLAAAVLTALPPFGIVGWAHPIIAAGVVFPGWGWLGLLAASAGMLVMTTRWWPAAAVACGGFWLWSAAFWTAPSLPDGLRGVDLEIGQNLGRDGALEHQRDLIATVMRVAEQGADIVVLPESALGFWTPSLERLWRDALGGTNVTVIAGAAVVDPWGYDNVLVEISGHEALILYRERMPVPVAMWQPWRSLMGQGGGAKAHFLTSPVVELAGRLAAPLICYEQLLVWPVLQAMWYRPDAIIAVGNGWWTAGTSIVAVQNAGTIAWARLFGVPLVTAFNR
ncbi:MAG: conjugal transfer protein TraB [Mesorhizobium sp.]|uniref:conjugal transfer protein TraB n=1 Tax=Mesorhizobium sp. TaxID=1871066 RepID=UPI000FE2EB4F|nr:conjugal transfer protein TraB [Mesorhizobium sp.]RWI83875.1 MAG: conjugal transfer protein TraB [Mesorhizobium sp.]RWJ60833.1 MAG: conjugal transfer protein TraB [Mesorhizobium sp.]